MSDMEGDLPDGWARTTISEVATPSKEKVEPGACPSARYLSLEHIESDTGRILSSGHATDVNSTKAVFSAGDVLYGKLRPYMNKVTIPDFDGICSTDILVFPKTDWLLNVYLRHFLSTRDVVQYANHNSSGVQLPRVSFAKLGELPFPLPPLGEQKRIVAKVEMLLARLNAARRLLAKVPSLLKRFRQSVLVAACSGQLTEDWREDHSEIELTSVRLGQLRQERGKAKQTSDFGRIDIPSLPDIPGSWNWCRAEEICEFITKGTTPPSDSMSSSGEIPFIKVYNLGFDGRLHFEVNPTFFPSSVHCSGPYRRSKVLPNDVLMNLVGPPLGKIAVVPAVHDEWNCNQAIAIYRPIAGLVPAFLAYSLMLHRTLDRVIMMAKTTAGQHNLTLEMARNVEFALPPIGEQDEIVRRVAALLAGADRIETRLATATRRVETLTQAILAHAFRGELVPTEAELARAEGRDYEPASVLLERIRTARANTGPVKPTPNSAKGPKRKRIQA